MGWIKGRGPAVLLLLVAIAAMLVGCGGDDGGGSAHVNEDTGSTNGLPLDEREGTPPAPAQETDLAVAVEKADCLMFKKTNDEGTEEVPPGTQASYQSDVPSSGKYVEPPHQQADGAYALMPEPIDSLGSLNHGRMAIQYATSLPEGVQLKLKGLYDTMYGGTLLFPNENMSFAVAATTWRAILGCTTWYGDKTIDAVRAFGKETWGTRGSEPVENFPVEGPTPRNPEEPDAS
jgi:hypothetical protein